MTSSPSSPQPDIAVRYGIDAAVSRCTVQAFAGGLLSAFAHNPLIAVSEIAGEVRVDSSEVERSSLTVTIKAASLTVVGNVPEKDRPEVERAMHADVLESRTYPEIVFACARLTASKTGEGLYWASLNGELTLHGLTRPQIVPARITVSDDQIRASGELSLRQTDYRVKLVSAVGGTVKVKDEVKISFDIVARRQD